MTKIKKALIDWKTTIPGIVILAISTAALFMKLADWAGFIAGATIGLTLMGINTKPKA